MWVTAALVESAVVTVVVLAPYLRAEAQHTDQYADCKESCHWSSSFR